MLCTGPERRLTPTISSHIGQSRERDIGHLADLVKRRRTNIGFLAVQRLIYVPAPVSQNRPDGVSSVQFTNLLSRLLEQVLFLQ